VLGGKKWRSTQYFKGGGGGWLNNRGGKVDNMVEERKDLAEKKTPAKRGLPERGLNLSPGRNCGDDILKRGRGGEDTLG